MSFFDEAYWAGFGPDAVPVASLGYDDDWGSNFDYIDNEEIDLALNPDDAGRGSLGGSSNDRTSSMSSGVSNAHDHHYSHMQPSYISTYPSINDHRANFEIPPGTAPGDESHFGQDQVASLKDDINTGLDSRNRGRFLGEGNTSHELTTVDTSITTFPQGAFPADGPGSVSGGYAAPSNSIDGAVETDNTFTLEEAFNLIRTVNPSMITNTDTAFKRHEASDLNEAVNTGDNFYLHGAVNAESILKSNEAVNSDEPGRTSNMFNFQGEVFIDKDFYLDGVCTLHRAVNANHSFNFERREIKDKVELGKDHSELSIRPDRDISELDSGSLVRATSSEPSDSAMKQGLGAPIASQLPYSNMKMAPSNQEHVSAPQDSLELSKDNFDVASNNSQRHSLPLSVSDLSTPASPTSARGTFEQTEEPVFTSYADVELVVPTLRKAVSPVVALCKEVKILELDGTEEQCPNPV